MSNLGQSVVAQLEAVLAEIETRTAHRQRCPAYPATVRIGDAPSGHNTYTVTTLWCECDRLARVRTEIARTVERMLDAAVRLYADYWIMLVERRGALSARPHQEPV